MLRVYFESKQGAVEIGTFKSEEMYMKMLPLLEQIAKEDGYEKVSESIESEWEGNASHYLSGDDIPAQVEAIANHPNQEELIDNVQDVEVWEPLEGHFTCAGFLATIGY